MRVKRSFRDRSRMAQTRLCGASPPGLFPAKCPARAALGLGGGHARGAFLDGFMALGGLVPGPRQRDAPGQRGGVVLARLLVYGAAEPGFDQVVFVRGQGAVSRGEQGISLLAPYYVLTVTSLWTRSLARVVRPRAIFACGGRGAASAATKVLIARAECAVAHRAVQAVQARKFCSERAARRAVRVDHHSAEADDSEAGSRNDPDEICGHIV